MDGKFYCSDKSCHFDGRLCDDCKLRHCFDGKLRLGLLLDMVLAADGGSGRMDEGGGQHGSPLFERHRCEWVSWRVLL